MQLTVPTKLVEVGEWFDEGYKPVLDFHGWRVAVLRYCDGVMPVNLHQVERHRETNEVFILTAGKADLIIFDGDAKPTRAYVFPMVQNVAYNIQQAVWHHVLMTPDAHIILFERTNTARENSDYAELSADVIKEIKSQSQLK